MRRFLKGLTAALVALGLLSTAPAYGKPKKSGAVVKQKDRKNEAPSPNDKSSNEGAQGRRNATEDAARNAESPAGAPRP